MKLTQIAVVAAALFGGANAAGDVAGRKDGDELGIDCGGDGQSDCTCWTDTTYGQNGFVPPTLVNDNVNRSGVDSDRETGLYTDGSSNTFLEVVIDLDASVFTEDATNFVEGTQPAKSGSAGSYHLTSGLTSFATANAYKNPIAYFVDSSNNALGDCTFDATGSSTSTEVGSANGALFIKRPTTTADVQYGTDGNQCANNQFQVHFRTDFKEMLGNCGWTSSITSGDLIDGEDTSDASTTDEVVGNSYTRYLGRVKIETTRQLGELRGAENVLKEEYAFQITVLFPNTLTVTSSEVSVIGEATHQAQLTHQIYDSTANNLNLNMLVGTTYPYAVTTADLTSPDYTSSLVLNATNTPFLDRPAFALVQQDLTAGSDWLTYCAAGVERGLAYANDKLCDHDDSKSVTLGDFVTVVNDGDAFYSQNADQAAYFGTLTPGGSALPTQKCTGENQSPASENGQACLQNTFMRLVPHDTYCDFNLGLKLTLNAVCRDDYNGNGDDADSIISQFGDSGTPTDVPGWPVMSSNRLFTGTARLPCDSATYRTNIDPSEALNFQLASDNFCPRVIAEASLNTPEMAIYESTFGETTWGAHGCADSTACRTELDAVANSAACSTGNPATDGNACLSVPGYAADAASPSATQRKIQDEFVFGTTVYVETRVAVTSGVNIESTEITEAWIARSERPDDNVARAANEFPTGATKDTSLATNEMWQKRIINNKIAVDNEEYTAADGGKHTGDDYVSLSNFVTTNDLVVRTGGNFLTTNPAGVGTEAAKLGANFEGVSRFTVQMNEFTVLITDSLGEAAEPIAFYANIDIKYKNANLQGQLGTTKTSHKVPSGMANRARSLAAPAVTGGQASAQAGIRPAGTTGAAGSSSTIAGFSSTTVLAAAAVLGAVVVAAGASFFVVRKRRAAAAKTAKRSSSSTELNDTAQVQV